MKDFVKKINVARGICDHLLDNKHTDKHRMAVGGMIIFVGVLISKIHVEFIIIHYFLDGIGYAIHGIGLTPFIEKLTHSFNSEEKEKDKDKIE